MRKARTWARLLGAALLPLPLLGCAKDEATGSDTSNLSDNHLDADNCELFVDKAIPIRSSHGSRRIAAYIKTLNDRLDSPPARVGIRYAVHDPKDECHSAFSMVGCADVGGFADHDAAQVAPDYFSFFFEIGNDFTFDHQYEGVFFVITQKGTTYWHKTAEHGNFFLDEQTLENLENSIHGQGVMTPIFSPDPGPMPKTADFFDYLNGHRCR